MIHFLLIYTLISFMAYWAFIYKKFGILPSISDSYYKLSVKGRVLFTFFIWSVAFPIAIIGDSAILFAAGAALAFVGAAGAFRDDLTEKVHVAGAIGGIVIGYIGIIVDLNDYMIPVLFIASFIYLTLKRVKNKTWWIETAAFIGVIISLAISRW